jgi:hypothetical protein
VKLLRAGSAKKQSNLQDEATFPGLAVIPKRTIALIAPTNNGDAIMLLLILNAIYRRFLLAALSGISSQRGAKL